jgi:hypothetical protein
LNKVRKRREEKKTEGLKEERQQGNNDAENNEEQEEHADKGIIIINSLTIDENYMTSHGIVYLLKSIPV